MPFEQEDVLKVSGALTVAAVEELRQEWLAWLGRYPGLVLDLSAVSSCDTAGAQLLIAARKSAMQAGKPFRLLQVPHEVLACCAGLGIAASEFADVAGVAAQRSAP